MNTLPIRHFSRRVLISSKTKIREDTPAPAVYLLGRGVPHCKGADCGYVCQRTHPQTEYRLLEVPDGRNHLEPGKLVYPFCAAAADLSAYGVGCQPGAGDGGQLPALSALWAAHRGVGLSAGPQAHDDSGRHWQRVSHRLYSTP